MILQAYDFLELNRRYGCILQMGGSDQWGNIVSGADLIRRVEHADAFGLTTPLVTRADGKKMGKSADGAVWLNEDMMSSYEFWQWWRNVPDADVGKFLRMFTELPVDECERLGGLGGSEINEAKILLANEVTGLCRGAEAAAAAEATAREVFEKGGVGDDLPTLELTLDEIRDGISAVQLIVRSGLVKSGKEAKRLIAEHGARVNDEPMGGTFWGQSVLPRLTGCPAPGAGGIDCGGRDPDEGLLAPRQPGPPCIPAHRKRVSASRRRPDEIRQ